MSSYARPLDGYVALWPHIDLGANLTKALYAVGCRESRQPVTAKGFAVLVHDGSRPQGRPQRLQAGDLVLARAEAVKRAEGQAVTLLQAVARGQVTVWRKVERIDPGYTRGGRLVCNDGTLAEKAFNPRVQTSLREFTNRLSKTVTHDLSAAITPVLKERLQNWATLERADWANMTATQFNEAFVEARKLLKGAVDKGLGLAAPGIQTKFDLSLVDLHRQNKVLLRDTHLPRIQVSFNQVDEQVLGQISSQAGFWIRDSSGQISDSLTKQARGIVEDGVRQGVGRSVIGNRLISQLPDVYKAYSLNYARTVAANAVSRARSYSEASSYASAGIQYLEVMAMLDEATTDICRALDGTIIPVQESLQHSIASANVADPQDIQRVSPFMQERRNRQTGDKEIWIRGGPLYATVQRSGFGNKDDRGTTVKHLGSAKLGRNGVTMPPYHHQCRTMTVPRTEMVQVPAGYEARSEAVPSTDDHRPPSQPVASKPRQQPQQRPIAQRRIPTARKPVTDGQSKKIDNVRRERRADPADGPITIREAVPAEDIKGYRRMTRANLKRVMNTDSVRITDVQFKRTHHGGSLVYEYRTGEGIRGTWSVEVPKHQMAKLERELKAKLKKNRMASGDGVAFFSQRSKAQDAIDWEDGDIWGRALDAISGLLRDDLVFIDAAALAFPGFNKKSADDRAVLAELFMLAHVDAWSVSTADTADNLHYLQLAAVEEFSLPRNVVGSLDSVVVARLRGLKRYDKMIAGYRRYVRAQYIVTQEYLRRAKVGSMQLWKAASVRRRQDGPTNATWTGEAAVGTIGTQPLSSYTADEYVALGFVHGKANAVFVHQEVAADRVYALYPSGLGDAGHMEVVVIGHDKFKCEHTTWRFASVVSYAD